MIIKCDRIHLPDLEDEKLKEVEAQRMKRVKCVFDMEDVALFNEYRHLKNKFIEVIFYYADPIIIDYPFDEFEKAYEQAREEKQGGDWQPIISAN